MCCQVLVRFNSRITLLPIWADGWGENELSVLVLLVYGSCSKSVFACAQWGLSTARKDLVALCENCVVSLCGLNICLILMSIYLSICLFIDLSICIRLNKSLRLLTLQETQAYHTPPTRWCCWPPFNLEEVDECRVSEYSITENHPEPADAAAGWR